jgi:predicted nucleic-acid-binding Zn-ribbon protein
MNEEMKCPRCGSTNLENGSVHCGGKVCFRPKRVKFLTTKTPDVSIEANICMDCGHLEFVGDQEKTKLLIASE